LDGTWLKTGWRRQKSTCMLGITFRGKLPWCSCRITGCGIVQLGYRFWILWNNPSTLNPRCHGVRLHSSLPNLILFWQIWYANFKIPYIKEILKIKIHYHQCIWFCLRDVWDSENGVERWCAWPWAGENYLLIQTWRPLLHSWNHRTRIGPTIVWFCFMQDTIKSPEQSWFHMASAYWICLILFCEER
jgi:hypothetical protein